MLRLSVCAGTLTPDARPIRQVDGHSAQQLFPDFNSSLHPVFECTLPLEVARSLAATRGPHLLRVGNKVLRTAHYPDLRDPDFSTLPSRPVQAQHSPFSPSTSVKDRLTVESSKYLGNNTYEITLDAGDDGSTFCFSRHKFVRPHLRSASIFISDLLGPACLAVRK